MKRATAIRNAQQIAERLRSVTGILMTPDGNRESVRIKKAWVFGSTAKGSDQPNDLDVLLECYAYGEHRHPNNKGSRNKASRVGIAKTNKDYLKRYRIIVGHDALFVMQIWLGVGMKMVRFHDFTIDGNLAHPRKMIYPRWEL